MPQVRRTTPLSNGKLSLLDRLTDTSSSEVANLTLTLGEMPLEDIEASIVRDLSWLLGTTCFAATRDLSRWKNVQFSVLNYGIPSLVGLSTHGVDLTLIERRIKEAIARFEPRLHPDSIDVTAETAENLKQEQSVVLKIQAQYTVGNLWQTLSLIAKLDSESGRVESINRH